MRVAETAGLSDAGRKRRRNEDSYVVEPPLFAVADGMGGAQAGEVASRLAAAAFRDYHEADERGGEERLVAIIQEANRRIYERAREDRGATGMGTTVTAALVADDRIVVGHVGDSRAYRIRDSRLEQLTEDHSLVADLVRSGRLAPAEAETHPQRSVITRALGTDPEVDVDVFTLEAEPGDVLLLCSDGLTTMIGEQEILGLVERAKGLESAAKALVKAANRAGGEDNITVVAFSLAQAAAEPLEETAVMGGDGRGSEPDLEDTLTGLEAALASESAPVTTATVEREQVGWPSDEEEETPLEREPEHRKSRAWGRRIFYAALVVALAAILAAAAFWLLARANFVGADEDGHLAVYQGLPYDLGAGLSLYRVRYVSRLLSVQLSPEERRSLLDHDLGSYGDARARLARYEEEGVP